MGPGFDLFSCASDSVGIPVFTTNKPVECSRVWPFKDDAEQQSDPMTQNGIATETQQSAAATQT